MHKKLTRSFYTSITVETTTVEATTVEPTTTKPTTVEPTTTEPTTTRKTCDDTSCKHCIVAGIRISPHTVYPGGREVVRNTSALSATTE